MGWPALLLKMNEMNEKICAPSCEHCGESMTFERMTPKSSLIPEFRTFVCSECGDVETIEVITVCEGKDEPIYNLQEELMDSHRPMITLQPLSRHSGPGWTSCAFQHL